MARKMYCWGGMSTPNMKSIAITLTLCSALIGCDPPRTGSSVDPRDAPAPSGAKVLAQLQSDRQVRAAVAWAAVEIDLNRPKGVARLIATLKDDLRGRGLDVSSLDKIDDRHIGQPLPLYGIDHATLTHDLSDGLGQKRQSLGQPPTDSLEQWFECPLYAPGEDQGTACDELVQAVLIKVRQAIEQDHQAALDELLVAYEGQPELAQKFIAAWAQAAEIYGANVAAIYAEHELRAAAQCDDDATVMRVSVQLGTEQGIEIVEGYREWAEQQVRSCVVDTDVIAEQVRVMSKNQVTSYMELHAVCVSADFSGENAMLKESEVSRRTGILRGIDHRVQVLRQQLYSLRQQTPCYCETPDFSTTVTTPRQQGSCWVDVGGWSARDNRDSRHRYQGWWRASEIGKFCCRLKGRKEVCVGKYDNGDTGYCHVGGDTMRCDCEHVHVGSPLVIDLDGDGLAFADRTVRFDLHARGQAQRTSWIGPREALLAVDLDGDGKINSGAELFGNASDCDGRRCFDGVVALARFDRAVDGGNGDGRIDRDDAVFSRLLLWRDANQDGVSQPAELTSPDELGLVGLDVGGATYQTERYLGGTSTVRLRVLTREGFRDAYDVWFYTRLETPSLAAMMPRDAR